MQPPLRAGMKSGDGTELASYTGASITSLHADASAASDPGTPTGVPLEERQRQQLLSVAQRSAMEQSTGVGTLPECPTVTGTTYLDWWLSRRPLGLELSWELLAIFSVYFIYGALDVMGKLAVRYFIKDDLQSSPAQMEFWAGVQEIPFLLRPLYGFCTDAVPILGYRRKPYLVVFGFVGVFAWWSMGSWVMTIQAASAMMAFTILSESFSMVVVDSVVVQRSQAAGTQAVASSYQTLCWGAQAAGKLPAAWLSGSLVAAIGARDTLWFISLAPMLFAASAFLIQEEPREPVDAHGPGWLEIVRTQMKLRAAALWHAIQDQAILLPTLFLFAWGVTPTVSAPLFYFMTNQLNFSKEFMGRMQMLEGISQLLGVLLFNRWFKRAALWKLFLGTLVAGIVVNLTMLLLITGVNRDLMLPDKMFALVDDAVMAGIARVAMLPLLVLATRVCPPGIEATLFGLLMSLRIGSHIIAKALGSVLTTWFGVTSTNFAHLAGLWTLCTLLRLLPAPLLCTLPATVNDDDATAVEASKTSALCDPESPNMQGINARKGQKVHMSPSVSLDLEDMSQDGGRRLINVASTPSVALHEAGSQSSRHRLAGVTRQISP